MVSFTGVRWGNGLSLMSAIFSSSILPWAKHDIPMHDDPEGPAGPDLQGRLGIEIARHELVAGAGAALLGGLADSANKVAFAAAEAQFCADAEKRSEEHT